MALNLQVFLRNTNNPEQIEAEFCKRITPYLDLLLLPLEPFEKPGKHRQELEELAEDLRRGQIEKHFRLDIEKKTLEALSDGAKYLLVFIETSLEAEAGEQ